MMDLRIQELWGTYGSGMPSIALITVGALNKDGGFGEAFGKHLTADVVQSHPLANMTAGILDYFVAVHIGKETQAKSGNKKFNVVKKLHLSYAHK